MFGVVIFFLRSLYHPFPPITGNCNMFSLGWFQSVMLGIHAMEYALHIILISFSDNLIYKVHKVLAS